MFQYQDKQGNGVLSVVMVLFQTKHLRQKHPEAILRFACDGVLFYVFLVVLL